MALQREFAFSDENFNVIRQLIHDYAGVALGPQKKDMVYNRLARRIRALKLQHFDEYLDFLKAHKQEEFGKFVNSLTTNLTHFFREAHHFDYCLERLLPYLRSRSPELRVWLAGCSTGEEAYSFLMTLSEFESSGKSFVSTHLLATDLDTAALERASRGIYPDSVCDDMPPGYVKKYLLKGKGHFKGMVRVKPELANRIRFQQLNLMAPWPMRRRFDIIFCRNVLIYFDRATQQRLLQRFHHQLTEQGVLFLGHSESVTAKDTQFISLGRTIFGKKV